MHVICRGAHENRIFYHEAIVEMYYTCRVYMKQTVCNTNFREDHPLKQIPSLRQTTSLGRLLPSGGHLPLGRHLLLGRHCPLGGHLP